MSIGMAAWRWRSRMVRTSVVIVALPLMSCVGADRTGARRIADTGTGIAGALSADIDGRQRRLRDAVADDSFNHAYTTMGNCGAVGGITRSGGAATTPECDVVQVAAAQRESLIRLRADRLAAIVAARGVAAAALGDAYRAFAREADYDAVADMEDAVGQATAAVNGFAVLAGLGPLAPVAGKALGMAAGLGAEHAQKRRLLAANGRLRAVSAHMRAALLREQGRHREIEGIVVALDAETRRNLVRAGLLDAVPAVRGVAGRAGLPIIGEAGVQSAMARDPALAAAAEVATLARLPVRGTDALAAAIVALAALDVQHAAYARGRPVEARDAVAALSRLAVVARAQD